MTLTGNCTTWNKIRDECSSRGVAVFRYLENPVKLEPVIDLAGLNMYFNSPLLPYLPPPKRKIFVSYHHKNDQSYYDAFSRMFHDSYGLVYDNSLDRLIESDNCEYVMRKIREEYLTGTSCTIVLCGPETRGRKYVDWEIKATLDKQHGLIGIILPNNPITLTGTAKPDRLQDNINSGFATLDLWCNIVDRPDLLRVLIEKAVSAPKVLIENTRDVKRRNASEVPVPVLGPRYANPLLRPLVRPFGLLGD